MSTPEGCSGEFDGVFDKITGLTWRPWVGDQWAKRPADRRLLVVAESHYTDGTTPEEISLIFQERRNDPNYTRKVVDQSFVRGSWSTPTLRNIPKLLFGSGSYDRTRFWEQTGYYNFVQRLMDYSRKEQPAWNDFYNSWPVFVRVVEVLRPSFCLFIGVRATNSILQGLKRTGLESIELKTRSKVGRILGRSAVLPIEGGQVELAFVQHAGSYFSWKRWHAYLEAEHPELTAWLRDEHYATG